MDGKRAYELKAVAIERRSELLPALGSAMTAQDVRQIIVDILGCTPDEAREVENLQLMRFSQETALQLREDLSLMGD